MTKIGIINLLSHNIRSTRYGNSKLSEEEESIVLEQIKPEKHKEFKKLLASCKKAAYSGSENWLWRIEEFFRLNYQQRQTCN